MGESDISVRLTLPVKERRIKVEAVVGGEPERERRMFQAVADVLGVQVDQALPGPGVPGQGAFVEGLIGEVRAMLSPFGPVLGRAVSPGA